MAWPRFVNRRQSGGSWAQGMSQAAQIGARAPVADIAARVACGWPIQVAVCHRWKNVIRSTSLRPGRLSGSDGRTWVDAALQLARSATALQRRASARRLGRGKLGELAGLSSVDWTRLHPSAVSVVSRGARVPGGDTIRRCSPRVDQCFSNALPALSLWPATRLASQPRAGPVTRPGGRIAGGCPSPRRHTSRRLRFP
jgi:hypothetical protein